MGISEYEKEYPGLPVASPRFQEAWKERTKNVRRDGVPTPDNLMVQFGRYRFPFNPDVSVDDCLPLPAHYRVPMGKELGEDVGHALVALMKGRHTYVWGLPGTGKDALYHAWSALTRTPAIIRQIKPGTDIQSWFFIRAFNANGTFWEEGEVLKALRDGYTTSSGRVIPYLVLFTDFDRADKEQAEYLRLIADSIQGRVDGPEGKIYRVFPGTRLVATGNTAGSGDDRGRMVSSNPLDASLMERWQRRFQFRPMAWTDEEPILKAKYPMLARRVPKLFEQLGGATVSLREAITDGRLFAEFSHRALETILGHATDLVETSVQKKIPGNILKVACKAWLDGLPDKENRDLAIGLLEPHFSTLDEGDTSHVSKEDPLTTI
jgi:MoxR-like ATPase